MRWLEIGKTFHVPCIVSLTSFRFRRVALGPVRGTSGVTSSVLVAVVSVLAIIMVGQCGVSVLL